MTDQTTPDIPVVVSTKKPRKVSINWKQTRDAQGCFVCPHPGCQWKSKPGRSSTASEHHRRKHKNHNKHACLDSTCGQHFSSSTELRQHMIRKHIVGIPVKKCPFPGCPYTDKLQNNVQTHYGREHCGDRTKLIMKTRETGKKTLMCVKCGKKYTNTTSISYHIAACIDGTPFKKKFDT